MRLLIVILILAVLMIIGGWLVVDFRNNSATVELRTEKIKQDTSGAVNQASENLKRAGEAINRP